MTVPSGPCYASGTNIWWARRSPPATRGEQLTDYVRKPIDQRTLRTPDQGVRIG